MTLNRWLAALSLAVAVLGPAVDVRAQAFGATFVVNSTADERDAITGNGECRTASNVCTLRAAVQEASALPPIGRPYVIRLPAGTYVLTLTGANDDAGISGDLDFNGSIRILGDDASNTFIDGNGADRVIDVQPGKTVFLQDLTIQNGGFPQNAQGTQGGGIRNQGSVTLDRVTISSNGRAAGTRVPSTGGMSSSPPQTNLSTPNSATLRDVIFFNNQGTSEGGLFLFGSGPYILDRVTIIGNAAPDPGGTGGLFVTGTNDLTITNTTVTANTGEGVGGLRLNGSTRINNSTVVFNTATSSVAGIGASTLTQLSIGNSIVANNLLLSTGDTQSNCAASTLSSLGFNIDGGATCPFNAFGDRSNLDPKVDGAAFNGGFVPTNKLQAGSPALDRGAFRSLGTTCAAVDARGAQRPQDGNGDGVTRCDIGAFEEGVLAGIGTVSGPGGATVGQPFAVAYQWSVPAPANWHSLRSLDLKLVNNGRTMAWIRWDEATNTFLLLDANGSVVGGGLPGAATVLESSTARLYLAQTSAVGSGPTGPSVTLTLALALKVALEQGEIRYDVLAVDDAGRVQGFLPALVFGQQPEENQNPRDEKEKTRKLTQEQKQQKERTNTASLDDYRIEGNVIETRMSEDPPVMLLGTRDGLVHVRLLKDAKQGVGWIKPGQYVSAEGEKVDEQHFDATSVDDD
ncbi:MAG: right-handed parallel beta-helix repeat-containing protein [Chloroflexota bacterium]